MLFALLFWLCIPLSLIVSVIGVQKGRFWLVLLGALFFVPVTYYLNGSPNFRGYAILLPLFQVLSAAAVREKNKPWGWLLLAPAFLTIFWFLAVVLYYQMS